MSLPKIIITVINEDKLQMSYEDPVTKVAVTKTFVPEIPPIVYPTITVPSGPFMVKVQA